MPPTYENGPSDQALVDAVATPQRPSSNAAL
jgi:hypothetical protein